MSGYLIDTNCISELIHPRPNPQVVQWFEAADESTLCLSVITLGEIRKGVAALPKGKRRTGLEGWLEVDLQARFNGRILPIDAKIADEWGTIAAYAQRNGRTLPVIDGLLAATALQHKLTLVSRNASDYRNPRLRVLNPWQH
jgi:predicted nucleic acid-binding protein